MSDYITKHYIDNVTVSNNSTTTDDNVNQSQPPQMPYFSTTGYVAQPQPMTTHQHTLAPNQHTMYDWNLQQQTFDPWVSLPPIGGLDELCELLGVDEEPAIATGNQGPILSSVSGKRYPLITILRAQMEFMARLNLLLVHRQLVPESE